MLSNKDGSRNTAAGQNSLNSNTTGNNNTAIGFGALTANIDGNSNTAAGIDALNHNGTGYHNAALGAQSLYANSAGTSNSALGFQALYSNTTGSNNIAVGLQAGYHVTTGSNNIHVGAAGAAADSGKIRIGTAGQQTETFIAGIVGSKVTGAPVYITANGQLGVLASSERYKTAIAPIAAGSGRLQQLRPVTFHLKSDPQGPLQYGLIAEQVAKVYPELVIRGEAGAIEGLRYDELAPILLKQVQVQQKQIGAQQRELRDMKRQLAQLQGLMASFGPQMRARGATELE